LINDPVAVKKSAESPENSHKHSYLKRTQNGSAKAVIPGATLKGWFRAQARRILMTLTQGEHQALVDKRIGELFGSPETGGSLVRFEDAVIAVSDDRDSHTQMFNAVDRFTGGVKATALYSAKALWVDKPIQGSFQYKASLPEDWMKLLLMFVWSDAKEGDLVLGWGKSKGFGRLLLQAPDSDERSWLEKPEAHLCKAWEIELHKALGLSVEAVVHE